MKLVFTILIYLISYQVHSQYGTLRKRQAPQKPLNTALIWDTMQKLEDKKKKKECIDLINYVIKNSNIIDKFFPDSSTAISKSYLLELEDVYYAYIIFTSSNNGYLYNTNINYWNNYKSAGRYSAGKSFNEYIYPYKVCDY
ncbi:hypothetical protein [Leeuwenhoekiella marinoflava]|uniref:Uncharacterized protein n=2 Tax=Leeuwenhoekiella marinoflava TaxID=988 RepID=A0A4Q0PSQ9_9FLAO|nr:hypothetical protein [Leeuwenhoekiella marinoflava]RXG33005.1 hypothetical protein DSL99_98 [Leeuwenhoekiella marinoflava]SHE35199.1 hypothetical protein SAMN02745246_00158 [Leeuwenhoekiella marinoflava DSM 3653]